MPRRREKGAYKLNSPIFHDYFFCLLSLNDHITVCPGGQDDAGVCSGGHSLPELGAQHLFGISHHLYTDWAGLSFRVCGYRSRDFNLFPHRIFGVMTEYIYAVFHCLSLWGACWNVPEWLKAYDLIFNCSAMRNIVTFRVTSHFSYCDFLHTCRSLCPVYVLL